MNARNKRLYLDTENKMIAGVCGGLARYFDIDPTLVRLAFVLVTAFGGGGVLAYVILWVVLPPAPSIASSPPIPDIEMVQSPTPSAVDEPPAAPKPVAFEEPAAEGPVASEEPPAADEQAASP